MTSTELKQLGFKLTGHRMLNKTVQFATGHGHDWTIHWQPEFLAARHGEFERDYSADELRVEFGNAKPVAPTGCLF
jgi:hypothetical protein